MWRLASNNTFLIVKTFSSTGFLLDSTQCYSIESELVEEWMNRNPPYMQDLATAFIKVLGNEKASKEVFNISGDKYVTFDGLAKACAKVNILLPNQISSSYSSHCHIASTFDPFL